jgi:hypothetical protein
MHTTNPFCKLSITIVLALLSLTIAILPVLAQGGLNIIVYPPDISAFPRVVLYVDAYDALGRFIPGLDLNSFTIFEDGFALPVNETQLLEPGLHTIIAINLGATLSNRANTSIPSRYETAVFDLASWLSALTSGGTNQYSLTSNEGVLAEKLQDKADYLIRLQNYKPNLFNFQPDLSSLSAALDIAAKPILVTQSKQSILYITPLLLDTDIARVAEMKARALETRVPVNVWLMAPDTAANSPAAIALTDLAVSTGGQFLLYTEETPAPNPESYLGVLRKIYQLRYTSNVNQSGAHTVRVKAVYSGQEATSPETPFSIDLTIPSAVLVDLPDTINRTYSSATGGRELQPAFITVQAQVIFPDGYSRQLRATRLYVDGEVVAQNIAEPFTFFPWPLENYSFSGEHLVSVEVEDILGFRSISQPRAVFISVESLYPAWLTGFLQFFNSGGWILFALLGLGGSVLAVVQVQRSIQRRAASPYAADDFASGIDPLLQTIPGLETELHSYTEDRYRQPLGAPAGELEPSPHLEQVGSDPFAIDADLSISEAIKVIGSDPLNAAILIDHPSVSPTHARIRRTRAGAVALADMRSGSGTWVNYAPISTAGTVLKDGDLIKIGDFSFRYHLGLNG